MAKNKKSQNIDSLIQGIKSIIENRCSLSDEDVKILDEVIVELHKLKRKRSKSRKDSLDIVVKVVEMLTKFLVFNEEISKIAHIIR